MSQRTVLVVDDEPLIRMLLADALMDEGYDVVEASNVLEAVAVLGVRDIDILITDVDMPGGLNGFDLVRFVRLHGKQVVIVVTSGASVPGDGILGPGETFLSKPYRMDSIISSINTPRSKNHDLKVAV